MILFGNSSGYTAICPSPCFAQAKFQCPTKYLFHSSFVILLFSLFSFVGFFDFPSFLKIIMYSKSNFMIPFLGNGNDPITAAHPVEFIEVVFCQII